MVRKKIRWSHSMFQKENSPNILQQEYRTSLSLKIFQQYCFIHSKKFVLTFIWHSQSVGKFCKSGVCSKVARTCLGGSEDTAQMVSLSGPVPPRQGPPRELCLCRLCVYSLSLTGPALWQWYRIFFLDFGTARNWAKIRHFSLWWVPLAFWWDFLLVDWQEFAPCLPICAALGTLAQLTSADSPAVGPPWPLSRHRAEVPCRWLGFLCSRSSPLCASLCSMLPSPSMGRKKPWCAPPMATWPGNCGVRALPGARRPSGLHRAPSRLGWPLSRAFLLLPPQLPAVTLSSPWTLESSSFLKPSLVPSPEIFIWHQTLHLRTKATNQKFHPHVWAFGSKYAL